MNFMNRKMFAGGGEAENPFYYTNAQGNIEYIDEKKLLPILRTTDIVALEALIENPDVSYSPATEEVFRQVVGERKVKFSSTEPSLFEFGQPLPDYLTPLSGIRDVGGLSLDFAGQIGEGLINTLRGVGSGFSERSYDTPDFASKDIFPSQRFPNDPTTLSGRPGGDAGFFSGIDQSGIARRGYTNEDLSKILNRSMSEVQDFTKDIEDINTPTASLITEDSPSLIDQPSVIEELPTFTPVTSGESVGQLYDIGSVGRAEQEARRLEFEKNIIDKDEFGFPLVEGRLLQDPTIAKALEDLTPIESLVDVDKTETESLLETQEKFDPKIDLPTVDLPELDLSKVDRDTAKTPRVPKETTGLFGSDRFLDFIRNVGGELVRTGQMGEGLASGAAKAGEERAARDLLEAQEQKKFDRELEIAGAVGRAKAIADNKPDIMKPEKILILNNDVKRDITDFKGGLAGVGFVDYAIEIIVEAQAKGEPVGGLQGLFARAVDAGFAFAGMGKDFDSQSADSKVKALTEVVKQKNLQAILGESGRTISDKDRVIIEKVFGDLSLFENVDSVLGKLRESRRGLAESNSERYNNIQTNSQFLMLQGTYGQDFYTKMLPSLQSILGIDTYASQADTARARFGEQTGVGGADSQPITDINL